jgi:hypothetical protein
LPPISLDKYVEICGKCKNLQEGCPLADYMNANNPEYLKRWREASIPEMLAAVKRFKQSVCPYMAYTAYAGDTYIFDGDIKLHEGDKK